MQGTLETRVGLFVLAALAVFVYMGFQIGAFKFDRYRYATYTLYFKDISGLTRKAEVKIAGVKVGWVEETKLVTDHPVVAQAKVMILKEFTLYHNAHAIVRQEGLLGPKYLEVVPGDPLLPLLKEGSTFGKPGVSPVSMDELLHKFDTIATNVEEVTDTVKDVLGGNAGKDQLRSIFDNLNVTAEKMADFSQVLERSFTRNEDNIDALLSIGHDIKRVSEKLELDVLPTIKESIERIADAVNRDFDRVAGKLSSTAEALEEASLQARDSFASIDSVVEKINEGKGLIGKLINEEETYRDLKVAMGGLKNYFASVDKLEIIFDGHSETMLRPAEHYRREDSKFYFDLRIHPAEDYFYLVEIASSLKGWVDRYEVRKSYLTNDGKPVDVSHLKMDDADRVFLEFQEKREIFTRNTVKFGLQFGKIFSDIALRIGLFEGTGGVGLDFDIPFRSEKFRWVTTFEMFDLIGWNREHDERPHLKWLNRMFVMNNIYFTFGADDFVSKRNANIFFGAGIRFGDDNFKYILKNVGGASALSGGSGYCYSIN